MHSQKPDMRDGYCCRMSERHSIHSEGRSFLVSTQAPEHFGMSFDDQQRRVGLPTITSMKIAFFFGFLIGLVTGVRLCVGVVLPIEPGRLP